MECEFCKKSFSCTSNLNFHKKTAKYCLKIQGKNKNSDFVCDSCDKSFNSKSNLNDHVKICKVKKNSVIEDNIKSYVERLEEKEEIIKKIEKEKENLMKMVEKLQDTISEIAMKSKKTITNNNTNNIVVTQNNNLNLNDVERIQNVLDENLDGNVLCNGQKGLARMIYEKLLLNNEGKSMYKCVDPSRQNFEFVNDEGKVERDVKATKLTSALIKGEVCQKALDVGSDLWKKEDGSVDSTRFDVFSSKVLEVANMNKDDSKFRSELSALATK